LYKLIYNLKQKTTMKKISLFIIATVFAVSVNAQSGAKATTASTSSKDMNTKAHVCTAACKDGKHVYAHGEKGHVCTDACKAGAKPTVKTDASTAPAKK
jgi:hypothetical protein